MVEAVMSIAIRQLVSISTGRVPQDHLANAPFLGACRLWSRYSLRGLVNGFPDQCSGQPICVGWRGAFILPVQNELCRFIGAFCAQHQAVLCHKPIVIGFTAADGVEQDRRRPFCEGFCGADPAGFGDEAVCSVHVGADLVGEAEDPVARRYLDRSQFFCKALIAAAAYDHSAVCRQFVSQFGIKLCQRAAADAAAGKQNDLAGPCKSQRFPRCGLRLAGLKCVMHRDPAGDELVRRDTGILKFFRQRRVRDEESVHITLRHIGAADIVRKTENAGLCLNGQIVSGIPKSL